MPDNRDVIIYIGRLEESEYLLGLLHQARIKAHIFGSDAEAESKFRLEEGVVRKGHTRVVVSSDEASKAAPVVREFIRINPFNTWQ